MCYEAEANVQANDDAAYARWLRATPEHWSRLCDSRNARTITPASHGDTVSGSIEPQPR